VFKLKWVAKETSGNSCPAELYAIMLKLSTSRAAIIFLAGTLTLAGVGCSSNRQRIASSDRTPPVATEKTPSAAPLKVESAAPPARLEAEEVKPKAIQPNYFELALDKAYSAAIISQSAQSLDDWRLVVSQWQEAIALMKAVPASSPLKAIAQTKIAQYQRHITHAQQQATRSIEGNPNTVVAVIPETPPSNISASKTAAIEAPPSVQVNQQVFQAPIKRRASGTPVIDVTFNGTQQVEMIVDTGASGTVITQQSAAALGVLPVAKAKANTASDTAVEFSIGYVDSMEVGGALLKDVPVAIAPSPELETGLLGHDFFGNYDVTIKRDVVEFRPR